jgi:hypothetical protein
MAEIDINIDDSEVRDLLSRAPTRIERALRSTIESGTALILRDLSTYPPTLPGQRYVRTGTLGRSWSREITGSGLEMRGIVGSSENMAPYNRVVQSEDNQGELFRGRWPTVQGVKRNREREIQQMFEARMDAEFT